jgi:hypothetical protein
MASSRLLCGGLVLAVICVVMYMAAPSNAHLAVAVPGDGSGDDTAHDTGKSVEESVHQLRQSISRLEAPVKQMRGKLPQREVHGVEKAAPPVNPIHALVHHRLHKEERQSSIFAAYSGLLSGERCSDSLLTLFSQAKQPRAVFVGMVEAKEAVSCYETLSKAHACKVSKDAVCVADQVRRRVINRPDHLMTVVFRRAAAMSMFRNERYVLMFDAPARFVKHWDLAVMEQWQAARDRSDAKGVVIGTQLMPDSGADVGKTYCELAFDGVLPRAAGRRLKTKRAVVTAPVVSMSFLFASSAALLSAPVPINTSLTAPSALDALYSARLWTSGFDLYTPTKKVASHMLLPRNLEVIESDVAALRDILSGKQKTGLAELLGTARSIEDFARIAGIDFNTGKDLMPHAKRCDGEL